MSDLENTDDEAPLYYRSYEITPQRFRDGWRCEVVGPEIDSVFGFTFITRDKAILHAKQKIDETTPTDFQVRVNAWMLKCFGPEISADSKERNYRFIEEALELVQALGCSREDAHKLVDYVFDRPSGDPKQEVGGVMVTLAALCTTHGISLEEAADTECDRIWTVIDKIRAKQASKPHRADKPLPTD